MLDQSEQFVKRIVKTCSGKQIWLAYSGGVDSHVLLHILASAKQTTFPELSLHAIHIDHGLNPDSILWSQHCAKVSEALAVDFHVLQVSVSEQKIMGLEAAARKARYDALSSYLPDDAVLLTAQHQSDQAETILLQLLRGAGPKGLSAMAEWSSYQSLSILRPMLAVTKQAIRDYAQRHELTWLEDPSNDDSAINRNYLRHQILPEFEKRWPKAAKTLSRSAKHCEEADHLLTELARVDLHTLGVSVDEACLPINALIALSRPRAKNVLRYLLDELGIGLPSTVVIERVFDELCFAEHDRNPLVSWHGGEIRRYQHNLYCMPPSVEYDATQIILCKDFNQQTLKDGRQLTWKKTQQFGVSQRLLAGDMTIRFRRGGERIRLQGHQHYQSLKHLFQQWSVPPWQRNHIPLIYVGDELVAVAGYGLSESVTHAQDELTYLPVIK